MAGENLLAALQAAQYRPAEDPYGIAAQVIGSSAPALVNPYASTGSNIGTVVGAGLLSALLAGLARNSTNEANAELLPIQNQIFAAPADQRAAILQGAGSNASRLSPLVAALAQQEYQQKAEIDAAVNKEKAMLPLYDQKNSGAAAVDLLKNKGQAMLGGQIVQILDPIAQAKADAAAKAQGAAEGETLGLGYNPKRETELDNLRKEFSSQQVVKDFVAVEKAATIVNKALADPGAVSDQELVRYSIQLIEPGMAVREGEQRAVAASQSIPEAWKGSINKALNGGTELSDDVREGIKRLAQRSYEGNKAQYDRTLSFYQNEAKSKQLDPNRVSFVGQAQDPAALFNSQGAPNTEPQGAVITGPDGQEYVFTD